MVKVLPEKQKEICTHVYFMWKSTGSNYNKCSFQIPDLFCSLNVGERKKTENSTDGLVGDSDISLD